MPPNILVVEDEPLVLALASEILSDAGFVVTEAEHADKAISILNTPAAKFAAIFTDINMPGQRDGLALARYARRRWPLVPLLVTSGKLRPEASEMPTGARFLAKPYTARRLITLLRELLSCQ
jgi:CheY-like chemotaxis protein